MKLELKHIAPYLPFDLEAKVMGQQQDSYRFEIIAAYYDWLAIVPKGTNVSDEYEYEEVFPLLRPMSQLIQEITHNGETFVPARVLWSVEIKEEEQFDLYGTIPEYWKTCMTIDIKHLSYGDVQKLIEWHFDIFKLIPNNLAIEIS